MLKFEKVAKSDELHVLLRPKPKILTRPFIFAFAYASFFHLLALFVFQIAPLKIDDGLSPFPPVKVTTEVPLLNGAIATEIAIGEESIPAYLIAPFRENPAFPTLHNTPLIKNTEYIKQTSPLTNPFLALEEIYDSHTPLIDASAGTSPLIQLSGSLANHPFEYHEYQALTSPTATHHFLFSVQLDPKRGELFWWDLKEGDRNHEAQKYAIRILKDLVFEPTDDPTPIFGEVSLSFACGERCYD